MKKLFKVLLPIVLSAVVLTGCDVNSILNEINNSGQNNGSTSVSTEKLKVDFIDVGQADCELVILPNGESMLIDAGIADAYDAIVEDLVENNVSKIDYLVGTHPHADHIGSMDKVVDNYDIGKIYMPKATNDTKLFERVLKSIKNKGLTINSTKAGMIIYEDDNTKVETLAPNSDEYDNLNDYSIVIKLTYKNRSILFTGDAQKVSEKEMLNNGYDLSADVLKVGHHGSETSTTKKFLDAVNPQYGIISCGDKNSYNHPNKDIVKRLEDAGVTVYRTDLNGTITLETDGDNLTVTPEKGE